MGSIDIKSSKDFTGEIVISDNGVTTNTVTISGEYPLEVVSDLGGYQTPNPPVIEGGLTASVGAYGLKVKSVYDPNTSQREVSVSGSINGFGVSHSVTLNADGDVVGTNSFGGVQIIGGKKVAVLGVPVGVDGVIRLGIGLDEKGISLNSQAQASVGFIFGEAELDNNTQVYLYRHDGQSEQIEVEAPDGSSVLVGLAEAIERGFIEFGMATSGSSWRPWADQWCFLAGTMIDMWPDDPSIVPDSKGLYDETAVRAKVWKKPIEQITPEDIVVSYDKGGNLHLACVSTG